MSCALVLAASLVLFQPAQEVIAEASAPAAVVVSVSQEPLFADLVDRSGRLKLTVDGWIASGEADAEGFLVSSLFTQFKAQAEDLAARDMQGHLNLAERGVDGDLKCILRGISEDMPKKIHAVETAAAGAARKQALEELAYLLNDNVEVITSPPTPAA